MQSLVTKRSTVAIFILPFLVIYTGMMIYPIFQATFQSFTAWDGVTAPVFTGVDNYVMILDDPDFWPSIGNGLIFSLVIFLYQQGLGTVLAILLTTKGLKIRGNRFFRTSVFIPVVLSVTVVSQLWVQLLSYDHGLLNTLLGTFGPDVKQSFLTDTNTAIFAVAIANGWQFMGIMFVFIYTAIKSIPGHYYEAAMIDGASKGLTFRKITLPLLAETYKVTFTMSIIGGLKAFDNMFIMTGGGPGGATMTLSYMMYKAAFGRGDFGYACVSAVILVAECLLMTLIINRFVAREQITY